ncbi:MAG: hypothetical protein U5K73_00720 [Halofilum sp. (in: g-proteobacteria)]|nr:hypothetical protein [Halofilum sp. (in: g-proteobacteria)]
MRASKSMPTAPHSRVSVPRASVSTSAASITGGMRPSLRATTSSKIAACWTIPTSSSSTASLRFFA